MKCIYLLAFLGLHIVYSYHIIVCIFDDQYHRVDKTFPAGVVDLLTICFSL